MRDNLKTDTLTAEQRFLLKKYEGLLKLAVTETLAKADDIAPYVKSNPYDFRNACHDNQFRDCFPTIFIGEARPTLKIPIVPFIAWISGISVSTIYESIELVNASAAA